MSARVLHFTPDYSRGNPYQTMLYAGLDAVGARAEPAGALRPHLEQAVAGAGDPGCLHVHWTTPILQRATGPFRAELVLREVTALLEAFRRRGGRLVWTVHNVLPHDGHHHWAELRLGRLLVHHADLVHVMSRVTVDLVEPLYPLDPARTVVVPHPSYTGWYPDDVGRADARAALGLDAGDRVLVTLGTIKPYKGLDVLVDRFASLAARDPALRLLVAGRPARNVDADALRDRLAAVPGTTAHLDHVPDDEVQVWLRAADLVVLPYRDVLNSGAFALAETFGLPVVAPRTGSLADHDGRAHVRLFEAGDAASLEVVLADAVRDLVADPAGAARARESARAAAAEHHPASIAADFAALVEPLLEPATPDGATATRL